MGKMRRQGGHPQGLGREENREEKQHLEMISTLILIHVKIRLLTGTVATHSWELPCPCSPEHPRVLESASVTLTAQQTAHSKQEQARSCTLFLHAGK